MTLNGGESVGAVTKPRTKNIQLEVVTPMFLGEASNAQGEPRADLRSPSIKGAMRFWHRACGEEALRSEGRLFGSARHGNARQSPFLLQLETAQGKSHQINVTGATKNDT